LETPAPVPPKVDSVRAEVAELKSEVAVLKSEATQTLSFAKKKADQHPLIPMLTPAARAKGVVKATEEGKTRTKPPVPHIAGGLGDLAARKTKSEITVSRYGPKNCVSTWRNTLGHCVVQTACQDVDISSYEMGLVCIDAKGTKTRHVFGRGSFDVTETFDTLAECSQCIGLDDQRVVAFRVQRRRWRQSAEASEVATLSEEVKTLTKGMTSMLSAVLKLRQQVQERKKTTPPPSVVATLAAWSGQDASDASTSAVSEDEGKPPSAATVSTPRLRPAAAAPQQVKSAAQVEDVRKKRHHRRRIVEYEDDDEDEDDDDESDSGRDVKEAKRGKHEAQDSGKVREVDDVNEEGVPTNGVGEPLSESTDAEVSELSVAEDGLASAGSLDDGSMSLEPAW